MPRLTSPEYLSFPLRIGAGGPHTSGRSQHVREQIEQVLFTDPGERVFRPEFGAGIRTLVFEPNASALAEVTRKRLLASLSVALEGEVDPRTLNVEVRGEGEELRVVITYSLATVGLVEHHEIPVGLAGGDHG